jgi:2-aminophenol/2-amino-5-chlorophenol 1,6-dioxygenase alpha subunit
MAGIVGGVIVPGLPHPLLVPDENPGWREIRDAYETARKQIESLNPDLMIIYSTRWPSVIGHQIQADPEPEWVHVDEEFHHLGSIPYKFRMDAAFGEAYQQAATARGLHARTVAYRGFPIDTGTIVALKLLNPDNAIPASVVSCNMYADRAETIVLGKAAADAVEKRGLRAICVSVTALSARLHTTEIRPEQDEISSLQDDEWNRKLLEILDEGRLEDVSQLARTFTAQAHADSKLKAIWWLAAAMGQHNNYKGKVLAYAPIYGSGATVVTLEPTEKAAGGHEFDEADVDVYGGDRSVLDAGAPQNQLPQDSAAPTSTPGSDAASATSDAQAETIQTDTAPAPVGAYPHARRVGDLLYLSGVGPRQPGTDAIPGGPVRDPAGAQLDYDIEAQTRAVIENVRNILEAAGSSMDKVLDVTAFLIDMDRDFDVYNRVYAETFAPIGATRTTIAIKALPTPIAVEFKVIAAAGDS